MNKIMIIIAGIVGVLIAAIACGLSIVALIDTAWVFPVLIFFSIAIGLILQITYVAFYSEIRK